MPIFWRQYADTAIMKQRIDQTNAAMGTESIDARSVVLENVQPPVLWRFVPKYLYWGNGWGHLMMENMEGIPLTTSS